MVPPVVGTPTRVVRRVRSDCDGEAGEDAFRHAPRVRRGEVDIMSLMYPRLGLLSSVVIIPHRGGFVKMEYFTIFSLDFWQKGRNRQNTKKIRKPLDKRKKACYNITVNQAEFRSHHTARARMVHTASPLRRDGCARRFCAHFLFYSEVYSH